ncbi:MAG: Arm DNA-binding domain-containing protein, partial [Alphaproteobacteria bacterium]|nr:Arm DNA-binding domain-containing protein [Alphaproteobacteria bacterium]
MTKPLTQIHLDNLSVPESGQVEYFDTAPKGFCVRVAASGVKTYVVRYRMNGRLRRYKIADVADMKLKTAREAAQKIKTQVAEGVDPLDERAAKRAEVMRKADTVEAVAAEFIEKHAKRKNRTWRQTERLLAREVLPLWG